MSAGFFAFIVASHKPSKRYTARKLDDIRMPYTHAITSRATPRDDADLRLGTEIIRDFIQIDPETQPRNVAAWTPVVTDIIRGAIDFDEPAFEEHLKVLYPLICDLLGRDLAVEMRLSVRDYLKRVGDVKGFV